MIRETPRPSTRLESARGFGLFVVKVDGLRTRPADTAMTTA